MYNTGANSPQRGTSNVGNVPKVVRGKRTPAYSTWCNMLARCRSQQYHHNFPTYAGATVCTGWLDYTTFVQWFNTTPNAGRAGFDLDKDLRVLGNK